METRSIHFYLLIKEALYEAEASGWRLSFNILR